MNKHVINMTLLNKYEHKIEKDYSIKVKDEFFYKMLSYELCKRLTEVLLQQIKGNKK